MTIAEFVALMMVPITVLATATGGFIGVGLGTKKNRLETVRILKAHTFGAKRFEKLAQLWSSYFEIIFGLNVLNKRQWLTIPLFTVIVSAGFFATWVAYIYIFKNQAGTLFVPLPLTMKQAAHDFYTKGIFATLVIVACAIQLTRFSIRAGKKSGYCSARFYVAVIFCIA